MQADLLRKTIWRRPRPKSIYCDFQSSVSIVEEKLLGHVREDTSHWMSTCCCLPPVENRKRNKWSWHMLAWRGGLRTLSVQSLWLHFDLFQRVFFFLKRTCQFPLSKFGGEKNWQKRLSLSRSTTWFSLWLAPTPSSHQQPKIKWCPSEDRNT